MPLYPFVCDECGERRETRRHMEDRDAPLVCQNGHSMRRVLVFPMAEVWSGRFHDRWSQKNPTDGLGSSW